MQRDATRVRMGRVTTTFSLPDAPARPSTGDLLDPHLERLGHELTLVERQLTGYSRRTGSYVGHEAFETVEPAGGRYRDELEAERERILSRLELLSAMRVAAAA